MEPIGPVSDTGATPNREASTGNDRHAKLRDLAPRTKRILTALGTVLAVLLIVGVIGSLWVLNRFVIARVEIADVAAYEAAYNATTTTIGTVDEDASSPTTMTEPSADTAKAAQPSGNSYVTDGVSLTVDEHTVGSGSNQITYFVADVVLDDPTALRSAFATNAFGTNIVEYTSDIADDVGALIAINADSYGFRDTGILIRNGVVYRDDGARTGLAIYRDGTMEIYDETTTTAEELLEAGVWNTLSFGPALVDGGEIVQGIEDVEVDRYIGKRSIQGAQPRTGIGMIEPGHYVLVVVDGRSPGYSRGMTMTEFAQLFQDLGCTVAYNLDGGGSATIYFNGEVVDDPLGHGHERGTSDILYIAA